MATVDKEKSTEIEIHENIIPTEGTDANEEEEGEDVYEVEKILGVSFTKGQPLYKVRWSGYSPSWDTWEPPDNLSSCQDMIDKYLDDRKKTLALGTDNSGEGCSKAKSKRRRKSKSSQKKLSFDGSDYDDDRQSVSTNESTPSVNKQKKKPTYYYASSSDEEFDTLKDKFWRDLDEGKVNVFGSDMYSKVKEQGRVGKSSDGSSTGSNSPPSKHSDPDPHKSPEGESVTSCKSDSHKRRKSTSERNDRDDSSTTSKRKSSSKSKSRSKRVKSTSDDAHGAKLDTGQKRERSRERKSSSSSKGTSSSSKHKRPAFSVTTTTLYEVSYSDSGGDSSDAVSPPYYTPGHPGWRHHPLSTSSSDSPIRAKPKLEGKSSDKKKRHSTSSSKDKNQTSSSAPFIAPSTSGTSGTSGTSTSTSSTTTPSTEPLSEAIPPAQSSPTRSPSTPLSSTVIIPDVPLEKTTVVPLEKESISTADEPQSVQKSLDIDPEMQTSEACAEEPTVLSEPDHVTTEMVDDDDSVQDQDNDSPVAPEVMDLSDNENPMGSKYLEHPVEHETPDSKFDLDIIERKDQIPSDVNAESLELSNVEIGKAVLANNYDRVRKALNTKKKYELEQPDKNGTTLAMVAAKYGYDDILELLVLNGANMNVRQKNGCTALMLACEQGLRCTVELLLLMGARVNPQIHGNKGESALIKAARRGHSDIVKVLLEYGANFAAQSTNNNTSLNYAKREDHQPVIDVLTSHIARVTSEFEQQVMLTLNNTATVQCALFPIHCFSLSDSDKFHITFNHELQPTQSGVGMLLFIAHAIMSPEEVKCRFYGPCAVMCVSLNTIEQHPLTDDGNFVMSFTPLNNGKNELEISTVKSPKSKAKLIVCAYKSQLVLPKE